MKHQLFKIALLLIAFGVGGVLVAASGIIPIKASSGHWPITAWLLHFAMRRSVATHTLGLKAPALDDSQLVLKGAGHYETGCRPCHGSPGLRPPQVPRAMTPHPPYLPPQIAEWAPEELFYIVKHGVKFTGMPAWPAQQRDDEVWAMVAFLRTLPELTAEEYRRLVQGKTASNGQATPIQGLVGVESVSRPIVANCDRCHGADGGGRGGSAFPKLAGQRSSYLFAALQAYAHGERHSGIMQPISAPLSLETMREIAQYYSGLPMPTPLPPRQDIRPAIERGQMIASRGIPRQRVPACVACHGPSATRRNPHYPLLAGQYADYLVLQLTLFKQQQRGGSAYAHLMYPVASRLTLEQMREVALYYESLTPAKSSQHSVVRSQ
jgi:cytochrome c553